MRKQLLGGLTAMLLSITVVYSQINQGGTPPSFMRQLSNSTTSSVRMPGVDLKKFSKEDELDRKAGLPPRFGYAHQVDIDLENSGTWSTMSDGDRLWTLEIICPDALSVNLLYEQFWLPAGARFYVYDASKKHVLGAFTERNNKGTSDNPGKFATGLIPGERIILEYFEPEGVAEPGKISVGRVVHGYRSVGALSKQEQLQPNQRFGDSHSCMVNVNCSPEGNNWHDEKKGIALILAEGTRVCSGSLINNVRQDGTPYFLTANHCLGDEDAVNNPDMAFWSFYWNYESDGCGNGSDFMPPATNGATVLANSSSFLYSDFALLLLDEHPQDLGIDVYYNGWDRRNRIGSSGAGIHHPQGDIKKISTFSSTPESYSLFGQDPNGPFWRLSWDVTANGFSTTQQGSSGSPIFDANGRILGQLFGGGSADCSTPEADVSNYSLYGKINSSWQGEGTTSRRLRDWLDPDNTNVNTLNGAYINTSPGNGTTVGTITREYWTNITGTRIVDLTSVGSYPNNPTGQDELSSLEVVSWSNANDRDTWADDYGQRIRGYIVPPVSGDYTFWIAGDDHAELYLSTNENPSSASRIAHVNGSTRSREWNKFASQKSGVITLTAGQRYYVEVLHKEGGGGDCLAVGWSKPGEPVSSPSEVVPGSALMSIGDGNSANQTARLAEKINVEGTGSNLLVNVYPNPSKGVLQVDSDHAATVYIFDMAGMEILRQQIEPGTTRLTLSAKAGLYMLKVQNTEQGQTYLQKIMVE